VQMRTMRVSFGVSYALCACVGRPVAAGLSAVPASRPGAGSQNVRTASIGQIVVVAPIV